MRKKTFYRVEKNNFLQKKYLIDNTIDWFKNNIGLVFLNILFVLIVLFWIFSTPIGRHSAPDEWIHYGYNVKVIIEKKHLPVSGVDDKDLLDRCSKSERENFFGAIPCYISYEVYPGLNYIFSAGTAVVFHKVFHISYEIGSRIASLMWGLVLLNFFYQTMLLILKNKKIANLITFAFIFIPQILFMSSYTNPDIFSFALASILIYTLVRLYKNVSKKNLIFFIIAFGLFFNTKYNYYILAFPALIVYFYILRKQKYPAKKLFILFGSLILSFLILSGFWFIRNMFLYHDPIGQNFMLNQMAQVHELGTVRRFNFETIKFFIKYDYFINLLNSFFCQLGALNVALSKEAYEILLFAFIGLTSYFSLIIYNLKNKKIKIAYVFLIILILISVANVIYNTLMYDYQAQGRYLFPIVIPVAVFLAYCLKKYPKKFMYILYGCVALTAYLLIVGNIAYFKYFKEDKLTSELVEYTERMKNISPDY